MQITIDTQKDSPAEIRKAIAFLEQVLGKEEKGVAVPMMPLVEEKVDEEVAEAEEEAEELLKPQETQQKPAATNIFQTFKDSTRNTAPSPKGFFDIAAADVSEKKAVKDEKKQDPIVSIYEIDE